MNATSQLPLTVCHSCASELHCQIPGRDACMHILAQNHEHPPLKAGRLVTKLDWAPAIPAKHASHPQTVDSQARTHFGRWRPAGLATPPLRHSLQGWQVPWAPRISRASAAGCCGGLAVMGGSAAAAACPGGTWSPQPAGPRPPPWLRGAAAPR